MSQFFSWIWGNTYRYLKTTAMSSESCSNSYLFIQHSKEIENVTQWNNNNLLSLTKLANTLKSLLANSEEVLVPVIETLLHTDPQKFLFSFMYVDLFNIHIKTCKYMQRFYYFMSRFDFRTRVADVLQMQAARVTILPDSPMSTANGKCQQVNFMVSGKTERKVIIIPSEVNINSSISNMYKWLQFLAEVLSQFTGLIYHTLAAFSLVR